MLYDDLSSHVDAFTEIHYKIDPTCPPENMLAVRRVIYSSILQRCAALKEGGSMSALALMDCPPGEPTEIMSIVDGHLCFSADLYHAKHRYCLCLHVKPAVYILNRNRNS